MIEPPMTLAILSLQKTCEPPAGPQDEDAFYHQYAEPLYVRLQRRFLQMRDWIQSLLLGRSKESMLRSSLPGSEVGN